MRISTRVGLGLGIVFLLSAAALGWQYSTISRLARVQHDLARVRLPATEVALGLLEIGDLVEEHLRKYAVTRDPEYAAAARRAATDFGESLGHLAKLQQRGGVRQLAARWRASPLSADLDDDIPPERWAEPRLAGSSAELQALRQGVRDILRAGREDSTDEAARSADATERALRISGATIVIVLTISAAVTSVTVGSINRPLRRMLVATQAVAKGRFGHRIEIGSRTELAVLAEHFNSMVRRLDELEGLKREFLSNISHEIKTPLVAMQETTRLLLDRVAGPLTDKQARMVELQVQCQERLRRMITDLLDLSRMDAGVMRYSFEDVDLAAVVRGAVAVFEPPADERRVRLRVFDEGGPYPVICDPDRVAQIVQNLVENAIRVSPSDGEVTIGLGWSPRAGPGDVVRVTVSDRGPGVPDEHKQRVFERFHQVGGQRGRPASSVGLGLTICSRIVAAHGGSIWVDDVPGGGATFSFELPREPADPGAPADAPGSVA